MPAAVNEFGRRRLTGAAAALVAVLSLAGCAPDRSNAPTVETILFNGKIVTADQAFTYGEAIALGGGRVVAVGPNADIRAMAQPNTQVTDLRGRTVVPGLSGIL